MSVNLQFSSIPTMSLSETQKQYCKLRFQQNLQVSLGVFNRLNTHLSQCRERLKEIRNRVGILTEQRAKDVVSSLEKCNAMKVKLVDLQTEISKSAKEMEDAKKSKLDNVISARDREINNTVNRCASQMESYWKTHAKLFKDWQLENLWLEQIYEIYEADLEKRRCEEWLVNAENACKTNKYVLSFLETGSLPKPLPDANFCQKDVEFLETSLTSQTAQKSALSFYFFFTNNIENVQKQTSLDGFTSQEHVYELLHPFMEQLVSARQERQQESMTFLASYQKAHESIGILKKYCPMQELNFEAEIYFDLKRVIEVVERNTAYSKQRELEHTTLKTRLEELRSRIQKYLDQIGEDSLKLASSKMVDFSIVKIGLKDVVQALKLFLSLISKQNSAVKL